VEAAATEALGTGLHPLGWGVHRINDAGSAPEYRRSLSCDIPVKTDAWREVFVIGLKNTIEARLTLLNHSAHRVKATQQNVAFGNQNHGLDGVHAQAVDSFLYLACALVRCGFWRPPVRGNPLGRGIQSVCTLEIWKQHLLR
jgi:hypothetical protein